jgi:hypothetical protein
MIVEPKSNRELVESFYEAVGEKEVHQERGKSSGFIFNWNVRLIEGTALLEAVRLKLKAIQVDIITIVFTKGPI